MDGSGYTSKVTATRDTLECLPVTTKKGGAGYVALLNRKAISNKVWDMPDGAMDEAQSAYEAKYPPFSTGGLRSRVMEQAEAFSGDVVDSVTACGFIKSASRSHTFSVWGKVDPPTVMDLVTRALFGQPVTIKVKHTYDSPDSNAWFTVTVKWTY